MEVAEKEIRYSWIWLDLLGDCSVGSVVCRPTIRCLDNEMLPLEILSFLIYSNRKIHKNIFLIVYTMYAYHTVKSFKINIYLFNFI